MLGVKVKGEGRKNKLVECAMCRCVSVRAHVRVREESALSGGADDFLEEVGKKNAKQERFRKKVHLFLEVVMWFRDISTFSCSKFRLFEIKGVPLPSIKHNLPFSRRPAASL